MKRRGIAIYKKEFRFARAHVSIPDASCYRSEMKRSLKRFMLGHLFPFFLVILENLYVENEGYSSLPFFDLCGFIDSAISKDIHSKKIK